MVPVINVPTQLVPSNLRSVKLISNVANALSLALKCGRGIILVDLKNVGLYKVFESKLKKVIVKHLKLSRADELY